MLQIWREADRLQREALATILVTFAVSFGVTFYIIFSRYLAGDVYYPLSAVIIVAVAGYLYLEGAFRSAYQSPSFSRIKYTLLLFSMVALVGLMQYFARGFFFLWILALPLAGDVDDHYPRPPLNLLVYLVILMGVIMPAAIAQGWSIADITFTTLSLGSGIMFVVVFSRLRRREKEFRIKAETLAGELEQANQKLGRFATQAEELATTKERNRIAREIHDNLGHYLTVVNVQLEAGKMLIERNPDKAREAVGKAQQMTQEGLQSIRQSIQALRVNAVENRPISEALADLCNNHEAGGVPTTYKVIGEERELNEKIKLTLYRIVQEGLTNSRKYADASQVNVSLDYSVNNSIAVSIKDDGAGATSTENGFGLLGIRERISLLGGTLDIRTALGAGFLISATIPTNISI